jgi:hypothetical protein
VPLTHSAHVGGPRAKQGGHAVRRSVQEVCSGPRLFLVGQFCQPLLFSCSEIHRPECATTRTSRHAPLNRSESQSLEREWSGTRSSMRTRPAGARAVRLEPHVASSRSAINQPTPPPVTLFNCTGAQIVCPVRRGTTPLLPIIKPIETIVLRFRQHRTKRLHESRRLTILYRYRRNLPRVVRLCHCPCPHSRLTFASPCTRDGRRLESRWWPGARRHGGYRYHREPARRSPVLLWKGGLRLSET